MKKEKIFADAFALHKDGQFEAAVALYKSLKLLRFEKTKPQLSLLLGICLIKLENYLEALKFINEYIDVDPYDYLALYYRGVLFDKVERYPDALDTLTKALKLNHTYLDAINLKGVVFGKQGRHQDALECFGESLALNQSQEDIFINQGLAFKELGMTEEALISFDAALNLNPKNIKTLNFKGIALHSAGMFEESLKCFDEAINIKPDYADALVNKGTELERLNKFNESIIYFNQALSINPNNPEAYNNLGQSLERLGKYNEALKNYDQAISLKPLEKRYCKNKALLNLYLKNFEEGWKYYDARLNSDYVTEIDFRSDQIFIEGEQGPGDQILFASLLNELENDFKKIFVKIDSRLISLFKRSMPNIDFVIDENNKCENFLFIGSLGEIYRKEITSFSSQPRGFLKTDPIRTDVYKGAIKAKYGGKIVCGISWKSNADKIGNHKTIKLIELLPVFLMKNIVFVNLQYGEVAEELNSLFELYGIHVETFSNLDYFNDLDGLASLIDACDFVITTSSITAHIAAAIDKKTYLLCPFSKGRIWYWHHNDTYSSWYPSLKIYRQNDQNAWDAAVNNIYFDACKDFSLTI